MSARRILPIVLICLSAALWLRYWMKIGPLAMSGGLYFPKEIVIPGPHFFQAAPQWGTDSLARTGESLAEAGCAVSSAAMALAARGVDTDPGRLNEFLKSNGGYTPEGWIYWEKAAEFDSKQTAQLLPHYEDQGSFFLIDWNLLKGNPVIARVRYPSGMTHFVLICGKKGFEYLVRDPDKKGQSGISLLSELPPPVEALRFYKKD